MKRWFSALALLTLAVAPVACTRVNPGHVGIKVVNGGSDRGVQDFPAQVGWVWYNPVTTSVLEYPTYVQNVVWTHNTAEGHPVNEEISFTNKDRMQINVDVNLSYHIDAVKVPHFYMKFRTDDLSQFTYGYLHNLARDTFNEHGGKYSIDQIMGDNAQFLNDVRQSLQDRVADIGVVIDQFGIIGAPRPPQAVIDQINASVHATQLTTQKQNELAQVQADAQKKVAEADGEARSVVMQAQGNAEAIRIEAEAQAKANRLLQESLTGNLLELKRLEKWDGHLPYINGGSTNPFVSVERKQ